MMAAAYPTERMDGYLSNMGSHRHQPDISNPVGKPTFDDTGQYLGHVIEASIDRDMYSGTRITLRLQREPISMPYPYFISAPAAAPSLKEISMFSTKTHLDINDQLVVQIVTPIDGKDTIVFQDIVDPVDYADGEAGAKKAVVGNFLTNLRAALG